MNERLLFKEQPPCETYMTGMKVQFHMRVASASRTPSSADEKRRIGEAA